MLGKTIAAAPLGQAGLGTLSERLPGVRPETIRLDAALNILADRGPPHAGVPSEPDITIGQEL